MEKRKKLYIAFMDMTKAYGRMDRNAMCMVLRQYRVDSRLVKAIKCFYGGGSKFLVSVGEADSEWFQERVGLKQGCVMSP